MWWKVSKNHLRLREPIHHQSVKSTPAHNSILATLTGLLLALAATGCSSVNGPGSASFASVIIQHHSLAEIEAATAQVFTADGYGGGTRFGHEYIFDKEASRTAAFSREGIVGAYDGVPAINRVRLAIVPLNDGSYRLQCKAYALKTGADEVPLANYRSGPYQALLDKVQQKLK